MSQPARLTSSLLARKGQALPAGAQARAGMDLSSPLPPMAPKAPRACATDNLRRLGPAAIQAPVRTDQPGAGKNARVALTIKLDPTRHARLKIFAARAKRTCQDVMVEALDALLEAHGAACECMRNGPGCNPRN